MRDFLSFAAFPLLRVLHFSLCLRLSPRHTEKCCTFNDFVYLCGDSVTQLAGSPSDFRSPSPWCWRWRPSRRRRRMTSHFIATSARAAPRNALKGIMKAKWRFLNSRYNSTCATLLLSPVKWVASACLFICYIKQKRKWNMIKKKGGVLYNGKS